MSAVKSMASYLLPGSFFNEDTARELPERSVEAATAAAPVGAFAFQLFDSPIVDFEFDAARFRVLPIAQNKSATHYLGGTVYSRAEIEMMGEDKRILAANMKGNGWARVIQTRAGNWQPFNDDDVLLEASDAA